MTNQVVRFNLVTPEGFNGVRDELEQAGFQRGAVIDEQASATALIDAMIFDALDQLWAVLAPPAVLQGELDGAWDLTQRRFSLGIQLKLTDPSPTVSGAARVVEAALMPDGIKQTQYTYEAEVNYGLKQIQSAKEPHIAQALHDASLTALFDDCAAATSAFADGLGRSPDKKRHEARSLRLRVVTRECVRVFTLAHDLLTRHIALTPTGTGQDALRRRLNVLTKLSERST